MLFQTYSIHATRGLLTGLSPSRDNVFYYDLGKTMAEIRYYYGQPQCRTVAVFS